MAKPWKKGGSRGVRRLRRQLQRANETNIRQEKVCAAAFAGLREAYTAAEKRLCGTISSLKQSVEEIHRVIEAVCTYSVALPPKDVSGAQLPVWRVPAHPPRSTAMFDAAFAPAHTQYGTVDTVALRLYLEDNWVSLTKAVHLRLGEGKGHSAMMISLEAFDALPNDWLIREVATQLIMALREQRRKAA